MFLGGKRKYWQIVAMMCLDPMRLFMQSDGEKIAMILPCFGDMEFEPVWLDCSYEYLYSSTSLDD